MGKDRKSTDQTFARVKAMYNAHPFPSRSSVPDTKSDDRYQKIYSDFLQIPVDEFRDLNFLDAGCGTGDVTWTWRRILHPSNRIFAIDLSAASVNIARQTDLANKLSPIFSVGSVLDLALPDSSMDIVHCSGVLVAVPDPDRAFAELVRVLKPGGYIILALYHKYGRALHGWRRTVIDLIEREDIDRRAELGGRMFGGTMRKWATEENVPLDGMLYDQFGLPCESRYSVGDGLHWFEDKGIQYLGTWPPVEWSQLGNGLRFSKNLGLMNRKFVSRNLLRLFPEKDEPAGQPPNLLTRMTMQSLWGINQQQLFSISGRKE